MDQSTRETEWRVPMPSDPSMPRSKGSSELAGFVRDVVDPALWSGPGFIVVSGFPVHGEIRTIESVLAVFGAMVGARVSQTPAGQLVTRVTPGAGPTARGFDSARPLPFHTDRADVLALLCVLPAAEGGETCLASAGYVHGVLAREAPEELRCLYRVFPNDLRGEAFPGFGGWGAIPVFAPSPEVPVVRYLRRFIELSSNYPDAPRLESGQVKALDKLDEVLARNDTQLNIRLEAGDLLLVNNLRVLHARKPFRCLPGSPRLLLRLWLSSSESPTLPQSFTPLFGAVRGGTYRGGVWPADQPPVHLGIPVAQHPWYQGWLK